MPEDTVYASSSAATFLTGSVKLPSPLDVQVFSPSKAKNTTVQLEGTFKDHPANCKKAVLQLVL